MKHELSNYDRNGNALGVFDDWDNFFAPFFGTRRSPMQTDIRETDDKYVVEIDMPGFDKKDISVSVRDGYLTVSATRTATAEGSYLRRERSVNECSRSFYVGDVDETRIGASYDKGTLTLELPKQVAPKARRIEIK